MQLNSTEISELIKQRIAQFNVVSEAHNEGTIVWPESVDLIVDQCCE